MANSIMCTKCRSWVHRSTFAKKKLSVAHDQSYVCARYSSMKAGTEAKKLCDGVEMVKSFCCLSERLNASGGSAAAVTTRARIGWIKI